MKRLLSGFHITTIHLLIGTALLFVFLFLLPENSVNAQGDTVAPQLTEFDFSPRNIDTSVTTIITVTLRVTDNSAGFQKGTVIIQRAISTAPYSISANFNSSHRISGDERDGLYRFPADFSSIQQHTGPYNVAFVSLTDNAENTKTYTKSELSSFGFPTEIELTRSNPDLNPPALQSFSLSPVSINTGSGPRTVTTTARITDDIAGFRDGRVWIDSPSGQQFVTVIIGFRISGDARDGIYEVNLVFPQNCETGVWRVRSVTLFDVETHFKTYNTADLAALGFPTEVRVSSSNVSFTGRLTTSDGRGVFLAQVVLTDAQGVTRATRTNPFGYYRFANVPTGEIYTFNITAKRYQFSPQNYTVTEQTTEVNFTANN